MCVPRNRATRHSEKGPLSSEKGPLSIGKSNHSPAVMGYPSLGKGEALHRNWGSRPQIRGARPWDKGSPVLGTAIPIPREWGTRPSGKGYPAMGKSVTLHTMKGNPSPVKGVRIHGNTAARHS